MLREDGLEELIYEGGKPVMADFGRIATTFGVVYGRLVESKREPDE